MKCSVAKGFMSSYMDGVVTRGQLAQVSEHLRACPECATHFASVQGTQALVGSLGRKVAPPDLSLKLRVALSQEIANSRRSRWDSLRVRWDNAFNATMVPATAGLITTLIIFGVLISFLYPAQVRASTMCRPCCTRRHNCGPHPLSFPWVCPMQTRWWSKLWWGRMAACKTTAFSPVRRMRRLFSLSLRTC